MDLREFGEKLDAKGQAEHERRLKDEAFKHEIAELRRRRQAAAERFDDQVLGGFDRLIKITTSEQQSEIAETEIMPEGAVATRGLRARLSARWSDKDKPAVEPQVIQPPKPVLRVVMGPELTAEELGTGVPVARIWLINDSLVRHPYSDQRHESGLGYEVEYVLERDDGTDHRVESEFYKHNPQVIDPAHSLNAKLRDIATSQAYFEVEKVEAFEMFVDGMDIQTGKALGDLLWCAQNPDLNPELSACLRTGRPELSADV